MKAKVAILKVTKRFMVGSQAIECLDLGPIKVKLMDTEEGEGWSVEQVNAVEKWYKRFLFLNLKHPSAAIVPNKIIDVFWHYHILDTMKYPEDCQKVFGYFLHHFPYFGMRSEKDASDLKKAFTETKDMFFVEFGESLSELLKVFPINETGTSFASENSARCGVRCVNPSCKSPKCGKKSTDLSRPVFVG